mgnify:CR=1 FL=1
MKYQGSCHCKKVTFEVEAPDHLEVDDCNCSICVKTGFLHLIVPLTKFTLLSGHHNLSNYTFNTGVAQHTFCKTCGIKAFYTPRSNPDGMDVNIRCFDPLPSNMTVTPFDGVNWEKNADDLAHKSVADD